MAVTRKERKEGYRSLEINFQNHAPVRRGLFDLLLLQQAKYALFFLLKLSPFFFSLVTDYIQHDFSRV